MFSTEMPAASILNFLTKPEFDLRHAFEQALAPVGRPADDEDDTGDDDDDDTEDGDDDKDEKPADDPDKQRLSREAAKHRMKAKEERVKRQAAEARIKELEDAGNDDAAAKLQRDLDEATQNLTDSGTDRDEALMRAALAEAQLEHGRFKDPDYIGFLLRKEDDIEVEDGEVIGLEEWVKELAKDKPELFVQSEKDDEDEDEDEEEDEKPDSGKPRRKKKKGGLDDETIKGKFPALEYR